VAKSERPRTPRKVTGKWLALLLALLVQAGFVAVLVFSVTWQNKKPVPMVAELYAPPAPPPVIEAPPPPPPPAPEVKQPEPPPKVEPRVETPDPRAAEIALKAKAEEERKNKAEAARIEALKKAEAERLDLEKKARARKEAEDRRLQDEKKKQEDKRLAEAKERQQRETDAMREQADREAQARAQKAAEAQARLRAQADWIRSIQAKIKGNVNVPPDINGNPEAIFDVVQLPTGEIIDVKLAKSSGNRGYDDAVERAIRKSSPLPRPERTELFQRSLTLKFRPTD
jgi:colicin import membrane protein